MRDCVELPEPTKTTDENGITTIVSWKYNADKQRVKVTKRVKLVEKKEMVLKRVLERSKIVPFNLPKGGNEGVTLQAVEEIHMEKPGHAEKKEEGLKPSGGSFTCRYCKGPHMSMRCPYREMFMSKEQPKEEKPAAAAPRTEGRYVPPSMRKTSEKTAEYREEESYGVRVSNLAEDVTEMQLRDLFSKCGHITRARVITDFETKRSRGFAFVNYDTKEEAQRAIDMFNGYAINHLILSVSFAEKKKPTTRYTSGYGKALPQNQRR
ncbi:hypothetical protein BLSTO_02315 [Blastocystis sp. subtype 1]